jgi:hypothetical protein
MKRTLTIAVLLAGSIALPATAADYGYGGMRTAYPTNWQIGEDNPLRFEAGVRYWYSLGQQDIDVSGENFKAEDTSHVLEGHFRIDDDMTSTFLKGQGGLSVVTSGEYSTSLAPGESERFDGGQIGQVGADFGWTPFGNESFKFGALVGYQYLRESPDRARLDVAHIDGLNIHALRLGVTARAELSEFVDLDVEVAAIPYAFAQGATAEIPFAATDIAGEQVNRTSTELTGALTGASGQVMVGLHPTENLTMRFGGRAWMLTGPSSATTRFWEASNPDEYLYESELLEGLSLVRYGALAELTGRF